MIFVVINGASNTATIDSQLYRRRRRGVVVAAGAAADVREGGWSSLKQNQATIRNLSHARAHPDEERLS